MEAYKAVLISFNLLMANETDLGLKVMVNSTKASIGFSLANLANYSLISANQTNFPFFKADYKLAMIQLTAFNISDYLLTLLAVASQSTFLAAIKAAFFYETNLIYYLVTLIDLVKDLIKDQVDKMALFNLWILALKAAMTLLQ